MRVRDVMTTNVVTIPSNTPLADARRIMDAHGFKRLPVVDKGKLMGVVSRDTLEKAGPSKLTTFSMHEISYLLSKVTVREVMKRDLVTLSPEATVEEAVAMAQNRKVGSLLVVEDGKLIGIATTNDFFYKIANPILGIDKPGVRFSIHNCCGVNDLQRALGVIGKFDAEIVTLYTMVHPDTGKHDLIMHLNLKEPAALLETLSKEGFEVHERAR
jgi:acetoin utilization protein AcuB